MVWGIIAFELVALNTHFYLERILISGVHMLSNSLIISDTSKTEYFELKFFQTEKKNMAELLLLRFQQFLGHFNILTLQNCSEVGLFRHLIDNAFCSQ